ncbi:MAG: hypothetical protein J2P36_36170, partial [Ktedonobacteraceae bacterium]|nr:hypothetical protein [Ktedonobacteraceae bacterium]
MSSVFPPNRPAPAKPCQRCGAPLPTNELTCRNCGYQHMPTRSNTGQLHAAWGKFLPPESGPDQSWHPAMPTSAFPQLSFPQQGLPRQQESFSRGATGNARPLTGQLAGPGQ